MLTSLLLPEQAGAPTLAGVALLIPITPRRDRLGTAWLASLHQAAQRWAREAELPITWRTRPGGRLIAWWTESRPGLLEALAQWFASLPDRHPQENAQIGPWHLGVCTAAPGVTGSTGEWLAALEAALRAATRMDRPYFSHRRLIAPGHPVLAAGQVRRHWDEGTLLIEGQPIIDLATGQPVYWELLSRWQWRGQIWLPDRLLPAMTRAGIMHRLDRAVGAAASAWLATQPPTVRAAINLAPTVWSDASLLPWLAARLEADGVTAGRLGLEITEHAPGPLPIPPAAWRAACQAAGHPLIWDDWGQGWTDWPRLTQLSWWALKVDQGIWQAPDPRPWLHMTHEIAALLGAQWVVEGVETPDRAAMIRAIDPRGWGQGWLWPGRILAHVPLADPRLDARAG